MSGIPLAAAITHLTREELRVRRQAITHLESARREIDRALTDTDFKVAAISGREFVAHLDVRSSLDADIAQARQFTGAVNTLRDAIHLLRATESPT